MLHHLTESRDVDDMFKKVKKMDYIEFAPTKYDENDVITICAHYGFEGYHCKKGSSSYKRYGQYAIKILGKIPKNMRIAGVFDPDDVVVDHKNKFVKKCKKTELKNNGVLV